MRKLITVLTLLSTALLLLGSCAISTLPAPKYYAIVYGIGTYPNLAAKYQLPGARNDGGEMQLLLNGQNFEIINLNSDSTTDNSDSVTATRMNDDFLTASSKVGSNDIFLFFYAGHGGVNTDGSDGMLLLSDYDEYLPSAEAVYTSDLFAKIRSLGALHNIVILDSCNSGNFIGDSYGVDTLPDGYEYPINTGNSGAGLYTAIENYFTNNPIDNFSVMTAAGAAEESYEWDATKAAAAGVSTEDFANNGVFTGFLLEAPRYGDANGDGLVTLSEAYHYTYHRIDDIWNKFCIHSFYYNDVYHPHLSGGGLDPVLFRAQ